MLFDGIVVRDGFLAPSGGRPVLVECFLSLTG